MRTFAGALILTLPLTMCCAQTEQPQQESYGLASAESQAVICADAEMADKIRTIMFRALDSALEAHIVHAFEVWMRDSRDQPARARVGITNGVHAYIQATKGAAAWSPMVCPG